jgi:predicted DCC family thiol-disulfide oxidoreductase YuxK
VKHVRQGADQTLSLFYDGSCPLCALEIGYYKRCDTDQALNFVDVSTERFSGDGRLTRSQAMARFHVRLGNGLRVSGAQAFVEVWRVLPGWRWLARLASLPGAVTVLEVFYRLFLRIRPLIIRGFGGYQRGIGRSRSR